MTRYKREKEFAEDPTRLPVHGQTVGGEPRKILRRQQEKAAQNPK